MSRGKLTVYRTCECGETAHDCTHLVDDADLLIYACRNCGAARVPKDARSLRMAAARERIMAARAENQKAEVRA